jgi:hypothetical protein
LIVSTYRGRRALSIENASIRVTVLEEGGHIGEIHHKATAVNPLWTPPWPSIEPSAFGRDQEAIYGNGVDARLLAGIMGHNLCLDIFGPPSDEEAAAGLTAHGEGSVAPYDLKVVDEGSLIARAGFPIAGLAFERRINLRDEVVVIREALENVSGASRFIGWTQHVTLGPPFLQPGATELRASATRSKTFEDTFGADDYLRAAAEFDWPMAPGCSGQPVDLRLVTGMARSSAYTAHLMNRTRPTAYFVAFSPAFRLAFGYTWKTSDFPWMGMWEENLSRQNPPWNSRTLARGMEFGVSPMPETRQAMVARRTLFGVPTFLEMPAGASRHVEYCAVARQADAIPESLEWPI